MSSIWLCQRYKGAIAKIPLFYMSFLRAAVEILNNHFLLELFNTVFSRWIFYSENDLSLFCVVSLTKMVQGSETNPSLTRKVIGLENISPIFDDTKMRIWILNCSLNLPHWNMNENFIRHFDVINYWYTKNDYVIMQNFFFLSFISNIIKVLHSL